MWINASTARDHRYYGGYDHLHLWWNEDSRNLGTGDKVFPNGGPYPLCGSSPEDRTTLWNIPGGECSFESIRDVIFHSDMCAKCRTRWFEEAGVPVDWVAKVREGQ